MHGGSAPPVVVPAAATLTVDVQPGYAGFDVETDGHRSGAGGARRFALSLHSDKASLVTSDVTLQRFQRVAEEARDLHL